MRQQPYSPFAADFAPASSGSHQPIPVAGQRARDLWFAAFAGAALRRNLPEFHAFAVRLPGRDIAAFETGLTLRHLLLRAALGLPPRGAMGRTRQRRIDD